jgi:hypothetical protein
MYSFREDGTCVKARLMLRTDLFCSIRELAFERDLENYSFVREIVLFAVWQVSSQGYCAMRTADN